MNRSWRRPFGWTVQIAVATVIVALVCGVWLVDGIFVPIVVSSGSMADALLGPHRDVTCDHCGWQFACDSQSLPESLRAVCPNCGAADNDLTALPDRPGERLLVDRASFMFRHPRRWETAVFRCPEQPDTTCAKRVVGLPGETVAIQQGDIFVSGQIVSKSLDEFAPLAIPVYDSRFISDVTGERRWRGGEPGTWRPQSSGFVLDANAAGVDADWLVYHHVQALSGIAPPTAGPILDDMGYNQAESRLLSQVTDIALRARLQAHGTGGLTLRLLSGGEEFLLTLDPGSGRGELRQGGRAVAGFAVGPALARSTLVEFALLDRQIVLALDSRTVLAAPVALARPADGGSAEPLAIAAQDLAVEIEYLQVLRDIYYTPGPVASRRPADAGQEPRPFVLDSDEVLVLGDNSSVSEDSRTWTTPGLPTKLLLGRPLVQFGRR